MDHVGFPRHAEVSGELLHPHLQHVPGVQEDFYKSDEESEKLVTAERKFIEDRVKKIIEISIKCDLVDKPK